MFVNKWMINKMFVNIINKWMTNNKILDYSLNIRLIIKYY